MNVCDILVICLLIGTLLMFLLLVLYHFESEKEKKKLIEYYEGLLKQKKNKSKGTANLDNLFNKK